MNRTIPLILTAALLLTACASAAATTSPLRRSVLPGTT